MGWYYGFRPYVPVAKRRAQAAAHAAKLAKKEKRALVPIKIEGRQIATSFWGAAWCDNLESYSDFANRLPRGRTYVRNGSVVDLQIQRGVVKALVSGSEVYTAKIDIKTVPPATWNKIKKDCARSIDSLMDLLQGRFDRGIMERLTEQDGGLFPKPGEIAMKCSCPDYAYMCKHLAAVLYGIGARLDTAPELLFTLRGVDHLELISQAVAAENLEEALGSQAATSLAGADLGEMFGIDLDSGAAAVAQPSTAAAENRAERSKSAPRRRAKAVALPAKVVQALAAPNRKQRAGAAKKPAPTRGTGRRTRTAWTR
jgi:uncharacterized Zn finger protein